MKNTSPIIKDIPLDIVGSTAFGRYPKISIEQTFNMMISDDWLVPYAGYKKVFDLLQGGEGRAIYASTPFNHMIMVIDNDVYIVNSSLYISKIASIETFSGDVFIAENNASQIAICDKLNIYIYNYSSSTFSKASLDFLPGHIEFQNGYFISVEQNRPRWRLSEPNNGLSWPSSSSSIGQFQTKPDKLVCTVRFPGRGNLLLVMGETVSEPWYFTGAQLFPYERNSFSNIDYGGVSASTIACSDNFVAWVGSNEKSGPAIMYTNGGDIKQISDDGINFKLASLSKPDEAYAFMFKQDGHLFYQVTWPNEADNFSLTYDFNTQKFFTLCDENMNYHIAKRVAFFNNSYFFVSFSDGDLYELNSKYTTYDGNEIPRIRVCKNFRLPDSSRFVVNSLVFTLEQGTSSDIQRIDLSISKNGGETFSNAWGKDLNPAAHRKSIFKYWGLGSANDFIPQFRFWGQGRFVLTNGVMGVYQ